jgi:predicted RND superfamily exporter protein
VAIETEEKRQRREALYRLGERLIAYRMPVSIITGLLTVFMLYNAFQVQMVTSFNELLPYRHPFVQVHTKFSDQFGGANNINIMITVDEGDFFTLQNLIKIFEMTQAVDKLEGVNHDQIDSIGHRTTRYLTVSSGTIATPPVMRRPPKTEQEVEDIKKICFHTDTIYGKLISLNGKAALIRANFIEGRINYKNIFDQVERTVVEPFESENFTVWVAGEPRLYGWIYYYAREVFFIFIAATIFCWILLYMYFKDWRGALRPTITGVVSAIWGLGMIHLIGFSLDPLALVIPFFVTARAVSHSVQMHERYYEEYRRQEWNKEKAIVGAFAELFVPTLSGIITDALGMLVIIIVPVVILQKIAIFASLWVATVAISELLLNPIVYYYLKAPVQEKVLRREEGIFQAIMNSAAMWITTPRNAKIIVGVWVLAFLLALTQIRHLTFGDPTAASPLLRTDSPYNLAHTEIQKFFGGIEPLIIVVEGRDKGVLKQPQILNAMEGFQRHLERDKDVGYSFSLADIIQAINMTFYDLQPRWSVIPAEVPKVSSLFWFYFAGAPPSETSKFLDPSYTNTHVTFFIKNHQGDNVARIIERVRQFAADNPMEQADWRLAGGLIGVTAAANEELVKNDVIMHLLGFGTIFIIVMFTYRSPIAALIMMVGLFLAASVINAYMGFRNIGINLQSLPVVTVGVGFGIDYALYIVSRAIEDYDGDVQHAVYMGLRTAGKAVAFTALTLVMATFIWAFSNIRFCAEMGLLLALWMAVSFLGACTFLPALLVLVKPKFFLRAAREGIIA